MRRANPRRSGRVRYAGFLAGLQGTVLPMELPGGLATIDPRNWHSANLPCSSDSNTDLTVFLIVGQAMVGGRGFFVRTRPEFGRIQTDSGVGNLFRGTVNLSVWQPHRIARFAPELTNLT